MDVIGGDEMRTFRNLASSHTLEAFQSHHLIPVGVFASKAFAPAFEIVRASGFDVHHFPRNGLFLPATEAAAIRSRLPLHRGPHRRYNELVAYRVAAIFRDYPRLACRQSERDDTVERIDLLAGALRAILYAPQPRMSLNRRDPLNQSVSFDHIDSACDAIWQATK